MHGDYLNYVTLAAFILGVLLSAVVKGFAGSVRSKVA